jgi:hypothetical protein
VVTLHRRGWRIGRWLRADGLELALIGVAGLLGFGIWVALDPDRSVIIQDFLLRENVGKLGGSGYLAGMVSGSYPVTRIWLGNFANLGTYAPALGGLLWQLVRERRADRRARPSGDETALWLYVLAFLVVYTIPRQRQENYLLPTVAALSVLLALRWDRLPGGLHRAALAVTAAAVAGLGWMMVGIGRSVPGVSHGAGKLGLVAGILGLCLWGLSSAARARALLPAGVLGGMLALGLALSPFDRMVEWRPGGREALAGQTVWFPRTFRARHERYRFVAPGIEIAPYDGRDPRAPLEELAKGRVVALGVDLGAEPPPGHRVFGEVLDLRTRLPADRVRRIVVERRFEELVYRLAILQRKP